MAYKIKIDQNIFPIRDGFTIKEEMNETLDSGVLEFNLNSNEFEKIPFDNCVIYDDEDKIEEKHLLIDNYSDEIFEFGNSVNNDKHKYTLSLFSQTKELERITIENITTTQSMIIGDTKRSVWYYIYYYCEHYMPKIRVYDPDQDKIVWVNKYRIDDAVREKFNNIECPEFQWNNPTLREVLNDLMSTADCIAVIRQDVLSYYDLKGRGNLIDRSKLSLMKRSMSSNDYVSELSIYMQNAIGRNKTTVMPFQTLRSADETGRITTENCAIVTQNPIYAVKKLTLWFFEHGTGKVHKLVETDRVIEYDEWLLLSQVTLGSSDWYALPVYVDQNGCDLHKHRCNFLYYKRGGNTIENLGRAWASTHGSNNFATTVLSSTAILKGTAQLETKWYGTGDSFIDPRYILYELEYETTNQHAMHVGKYLPMKHPENRIFDSQENSYIDIEHQSIFEYAKVNRLGNKIVEIYGEYKSEEDIPQLGDYLDDNVLFSRELTYYDDIIYFKGMMTENYILRDYFTSVRAKKRSWQIAKDSDALTSHNIIKYYVETSFKHKEDVLDEISTTIQGHSIYGGLIHDLTNIYPMVSGESQEGKTLKYMMIQTSSPGTTEHPDPIYYTPILLDCSIEIQGLSICYNFGFNDNYKSSDYASDFQTQSFYEYANDRGEYSYAYFYLSYGIKNQFSVTIPTPAEEGGTQTLTTSQKDSIFADARIQPKVSLPTNSGQAEQIGATKISYYKRKDNRQIEKYSLQFEYCSDNPDIIITPKYLEYIRMLNADTTKSFKIYVSTTEGDKYGLTSRTPIGTRIQFLESGVSFTKMNGYSMRLNMSTVISYTSCIGITDQEDNLLLGINMERRQYMTFKPIYFNLLKSRDDKIYFSNEDLYVLGDLSYNLTAIRNNYNSHLNQIQGSQTRSIRVLRRTINSNDIIDIDNE